MAYSDFFGKNRRKPEILAGPTEILVGPTEIFLRKYLVGPTKYPMEISCGPHLKRNLQEFKRSQGVKGAWKNPRGGGLGL